MDLTNSPCDVFLIGCFTLQRFSDYSRISPEMIQSKSNN